MNKRLTRWLYASVIKHFKSYIDLESVTFHLGGTEYDVNSTDRDTIALHLNGPKINEICNNVFKVSIEVHCLIQCIMRETNMYRHIDLIGAMNTACFNGITVYKYGPEAEDDDSFVGCLRLVQDARGSERVETTNFGQVDMSVKLLQATVEAQYEMYI